MLSRALTFWSEHIFGMASKMANQNDFHFTEGLRGGNIKWGIWDVSTVGDYRDPQLTVTTQSHAAAEIVAAQTWKTYCTLSSSHV